MSRKTLLRVRDITSSADVPNGLLEKDCRSCLYWLDRTQNGQNSLQSETVKSDWFSTTSNIIGPCGKVLCLDDEPVAWVHYGPSHALPRAFTYATRPSDDAYLIACLVVAPGFRRHHIGRQLLQIVLNDVRRRGVRAVEVFGRKGSEENPAGPMELYLKAGFHVKADDPMFPLLRYEFRENKRDTGMSYVINQTRYGLQETG